MGRQVTETESLRVTETVWKESEDIGVDGSEHQTVERIERVE